MSFHVMYVKKVCKMCKGLSTLQSPLASAAISDRYGGLHPWAKYIKQLITDEEGSRQMRVPSSKLCLICYNVWRALG